MSKIPAACIGLSDACCSALKWLRNRNGDGVFDKNHVLVAAGERAPVMRSTWNRLEQACCVEFYMGRKRLRVTKRGHELPLDWIGESVSRDAEL
jgi:hypothetical protein